MSRTVGPRNLGGRPSKGDRHQFGVRIPREYADKVIAYADATDTTYSDLIADLVIRHIDEVDIDVIEHGDNRLDVEVEARSA